MIVGIDQDNNGHIHLNAAEYERLKNGRVVSKVTEFSEGEFVIGCFYHRRHNARLTPGMIQRFSDKEGVCKFTMAVDLYELACCSDDGTVEGLNELVEKHMDDVRMQDITYRAVGVTDSNDIIIEVTCHVGDILDGLYDHYFIVKPETSGEGVFYLVGQNEPEFGGWTVGETEDESGPTLGETLACEPTLEQISVHAANYNLDKTPIV